MSEPFKVSHSKVKTWRRCRYLYHLKYVERLRRKLKGRPLMFGSFVHEALEAFQLTGSFKSTEKQYQTELDKVFIEEQIEHNIQDVVRDGVQIVKGYLAKWKNDGLTYRAVELDVELPLVHNDDGSVRILFIGKIDGIVSEDADNAADIWVFERKTAKKIPEEGVRLSDIQTVLYWWAAPQLKMKIGRRLVKTPVPRGIIWDYVRSKAPSQPKVLKGKKPKKGQEPEPPGLSKAACDTTYDVYLKAIHDNGLDPEDYSDMLQSLKGRDEEFYRRIKLPFSRHMRDQVLDDFRSTAIEMEMLHGISKDRNLTRDCSWCEFNPLCQANLRGLDTDIMLKKDYEVRPQNEKEVEVIRDSE